MKSLEGEVAVLFYCFTLKLTLNTTDSLKGKKYKQSAKN